jgi:putative ATPase
MTPDLFDHQEEKLKQTDAPLASRMRPRTLDDFVGQQHLVGEGHVLRKMIDSGTVPSMVFWGPPGCGKTTLAYIIATMVKYQFKPVSAVSASVKDLRQIIDEARELRKLNQERTLLFIDEIHRFNKAQQDAILPYVEDGTVTLIGATTENPSFEVITPLLSRSRVYKMQPLGETELRHIIMRSLRDRFRGLGGFNVELEHGSLERIIAISNNDARSALNTTELSVLSTKPDENGKRIVTMGTVDDAVQHRYSSHDKNGDQHYDLISVVHKSLRGSDPDAAIYWIVRMLEGGEDPMYIVRRLVRFASEDVGLADPQALVLAVAAQQAVHFVGLPEGGLALAELVVYLAAAPKSNALYTAYGQAAKDALTGRAEPVPLWLRNAPTGLMKDLGYGKDYRYAHDEAEGVAGMDCLPASLSARRYYRPTDRGQEAELARRLEAARAIRSGKRGKT